MKTFVIPGILWSTVIAVAIYACQTMLPPEYAAYGSIGVVVLMGLAKTLDLAPTEIDTIVAQINEQQNQAGVPRGMLVQTPPKRGKLERWLVG